MGMEMEVRARVAGKPALCNVIMIREIPQKGQRIRVIEGVTLRVTEVLGDTVCGILDSEQDYPKLKNAGWVVT